MKFKCRQFDDIKENLSSVIIEKKMQNRKNFPEKIIFHRENCSGDPTNERIFPWSLAQEDLNIRANWNEIAQINVYSVLLCLSIFKHSWRRCKQFALIISLLDETNRKMLFHTIFFLFCIPYSMERSSLWRCWLCLFQIALYETTMI